MRVAKAACVCFLVGCAASCGGAPHDARITPPTISVPAPHPGGDRPTSSFPTSEHGKVLDRLATAPIGMRSRNGISIPLPDADAWHDVEFLLVPSVVSVQYGEPSEFHAILGAFVVNVPDADEPGACDRAFVPWAGVWLDAFDTVYDRERNWAGTWKRNVWSRDREEPVGTELVGIQGAYIFGKVATVLMHATFACAYAVYPAWKKTCLAVGVAVPNRDDAAPQARALRDRFVGEVMPSVRVDVSTPPAEERH